MKTFTTSIILALALIAAGCDNTNPGKDPVDESKVPVSGITIEPDCLMLEAGAKQTLKAKISPDAAANKAVSWKIDDESIAKIDPSTGEVTALAGGMAKIIATAEDGGMTAECTLTVFYNFVREGTTEGAEEGVVISWGITGEGVLVISGEGAMKNYLWQEGGSSVVTDSPWCHLDITTVIIENGITAIGQCAFAGEDNLTKATVGDGVKSVGVGVFAYCRKLEEAKLGRSVASIGSSVFMACPSLKGITIPDGVATIGNYTFDGCGSLESIVIPDSVTSLGTNVFRNCKSLKSAVIGNGVSALNDNCFYYCTALERLTIGNGVDWMGNAVFEGCSSLNGVLTVPHSVVHIGSTAFALCKSLTGVVLGNGVATIDYSAFYGCTSMTSLTIGSAVETIEVFAFGECTALEDVAILAAVPPKLNQDAAPYDSFSFADDTLRVPAGCKADYENAAVWGEAFANIVELR